MTTNSEFEPRAVRRARERAERKKVQPRQRRPLMIIITVLVFIGLGVGAWALSRTDMSGPSNNNASQRRADKTFLDSCTTDAATRFHIHAHLTVIMNGTAENIPTNTGIADDCMHALHAHDDTGIIHVESPVEKDFTLGDWFYIWGTTWTAADFFGKALDQDHQLTVFADGKKVTTGVDTVMRDRVSYAVMYGGANETLSPPANYDFPQNL